jgi:hypothetical protein
MTLTLTKISGPNALNALSHELGGAFGEIALRRALAADHIRSALYANSVLGNAYDLASGVHTSRLLTSVRKTLDFLWPGTLVEHLRDSGQGGVGQQTLDALKQLGDIVDVGGGYWVGTPLRIVQSGASALVIGAVPNAVLKAAAGAQPICAGISRFLHLRATHSVAVAPTVSVSEWLGDAQPIETWTRETIDRHERQMTTSNDISADQLEIYAPELISSAQRSPWVPAGSISRALTGARLCRPMKGRAYSWDRPFYLSHLRFFEGQLVISRSVRIDYDLTRRLRFGINKLCNAFHSVRVFSAGDLLELELPIALPEPDARIAALGWTLPSNSRRTAFHKNAAPLLSEVMARLGITINVG